MKNFLQRIIRLTGFEVHRTNSRHVFWDDDSTFTTLFKSVQHRTAIKEDRAFMLYQFARYARTIPGGAAQLGVWKGGSSKIIAQALTGTDKDLILFDTFEGLPVKENSFSDGRTEFRDTSLEDVQSFLKGERVTFARGFFPDTALPYESSRFSFVYLDADLEESTQQVLRFSTLDFRRVALLCVTITALTIGQVSKNLSMLLRKRRVYRLYEPQGISAY